MIKKTIYGSTSSSLWTFKTVVTEIETSIENLTSKVRVENFLGRVPNVKGSFFAGNYTVSYQVNEEKHSENKYMSANVSPGSYVSIGYYEFDVKHHGEPTIIFVEGKMHTDDFNPSDAKANGNVTLTELHRQPEPNLISITEKNPKLTGITNQFVTNLSKKEFNITAKLYDNAKITDYIVENISNVVNSKTNPFIIDYSVNKLNYENGKAKFRIGVKDSLNSAGFINYESANIIPYEAPNLIQTASSVKRNGQLTGKVKLNLRGTFFNGKVGSIQNKIKLSYKYWKSSDSEPATYFEIPDKVIYISENYISINNWNVTKAGKEITDVIKDFSYRFKIKAEDSFNNISEIELICTKGKYLYAKFKDRVDFQKITQNNKNVALERKLSNDEVETSEYLFGKKVYAKTLTTNNPISPNLPLLIGHRINNYDRIWIDTSNSFMQNDSKRSIPVVQNFYTTTNNDRTSAYIDGEYAYILSNTDWGTNWQKVLTIKFTKM